MIFAETHISCPFDKSHRILSGRMQFHLTRCKKNYPGQKVECFFDPTHLLDPLEWQHHFSTCPSSGCIRRYEVNLEQQQEVGTVPLEEACSMAPVIDSADTDDWNANYPSYNPEVHSENKNVFRVQVGLSKAKRREFKQQERRRLEALEQNGECSTSSTKTVDPDQPIRKPKGAPKINAYNIDSINNNLRAPTDQPMRELKESSNSKPCKSEEFTSTLSKGLKAITIKDEEKENDSGNSTRNISREGSLENKILEESNTSVKPASTVHTNHILKSEGASNIAATTSQGTVPKHSKKIIPRITLPRMPHACFGQAEKITTGRGFNISLRSRVQNSASNRKDDEKSKELGSRYGYNE